MKKIVLLTLIALLNISLIRCSEADKSEAEIKSELNKVLHSNSATLADNLNGITAVYAIPSSQDRFDTAKFEYHGIYPKVTLKDILISLWNAFNSYRSNNK